METRRVVGRVLLVLLLGTSLAQAGIICDGTDDFLTAGNVLINLNTTFTIEAWVQTTATAANQYVLSKNTAGGGYRLHVGTTGIPWGQILNADFEKIAERAASVSINDGEPHHVVMVFTTNTTTRDSNTVTIYVDGALAQGTLTHLGTAAYSANSVDWHVCRRATTYMALTLHALTMYAGDIGAAAVARLYAARMHAPTLPLTFVAQWALGTCGHGTSGQAMVFPDREAGLHLTGDDGANNTGLTCQGDSFLQHVGVW